MELHKRSYLYKHKFKRLESPLKCISSSFEAEIETMSTCIKS